VTLTVGRHRSSVATRTRDPDTSSGPGSRLGSGRLESVALPACTLESGIRLPELVVSYRHDGPPPPAPQVLVVHALTGSADAAGDWWAPLIGSDRPLDTARYGVICANLLGGRYGTTGPVSIDPRTGEPWGPTFPAVSTRDQARVLWTLLDAVAIDELHLCVGGSLGGMVALETALERPEKVARVMPIAAPAATGPMAIAWNRIQLAMLERLGDEGLALARQLAMTTYRSEEDFDERFGRHVQPDGRFAVISYLDHQGQKLLSRFDRDTYRVLVGAMDRHDVGRGRTDIPTALTRLRDAGVRMTALGIEDDILYGPRQVRALHEAAMSVGVRSHYRELRSNKGHDAFLVEWAQLRALLDQVLSS
jgi:homoserine O-acetyltransferase